MGKTIITIVITTFVIIILLLLGYFFSYLQKFSFKYEIDISAVILSLLTLALTAWLAYWATNIIEKNRDLNKNEREITLSRISDFSKSIDSIVEAIYTNDTSTLKIASSIKQCNLLNSSILHLIKESKTIVTETLFQNNIHINLTELRVAMTQYPASPPLQAGQPEPVVVQNNLYLYTDDRKIEVEQLLNKIKEHLTKYSLYVIQS